MDTASLAHFSCDKCGKSYRWKPELAGRRVKCKCGHPMSVPAPPAGAISIPEEGFESPGAEPAPAAPHCPSCKAPLEQGAVLCVRCGFNLKLNRKMGLHVEAISPAPSKVSGTAALPLAYQRNAPRPDTRGQDNNLGQPFKDFYLPIILFVAGFVMTLVEARYALRITSLGFIVGYAGVIIVINLVLVFSGIMIATKLLDLGLGPIGPALMKIAAISVLPGPVAGLIGSMFGDSTGFVGWLASLLLTLGMFIGLLGLDLIETMFCTAIIWLVRTWVGFFLAMAILKGFGLSIALQMPSAPPPRKSAPPPPRYVQNTRQLESDAATALASAEAVEAKAWVAGGTEAHPRVISSATENSPLETVEKLYSLGATKVTVTRVETGTSRDAARQIVVSLPDEKGPRKQIFGWYRKLALAYDLYPIDDEGQKTLLIDYDKKKKVQLQLPDLE